MKNVLARDGETDLKSVEAFNTFSLAFKFFHQQLLDQCKIEYRRIKVGYDFHITPSSFFPDEFLKKYRLLEKPHKRFVGSTSSETIIRSDNIDAGKENAMAITGSETVVSAQCFKKIELPLMKIHQAVILLLLAILVAKRDKNKFHKYTDKHQYTCDDCGLVESLNISTNTKLNTTKNKNCRNRQLRSAFRTLWSYSMEASHQAISKMEWPRHFVQLAPCMITMENLLI